MSERLIEELRRENLCTHFILPLLKLNKFSFIASNFVDSYLYQNPETHHWSIVVKVVEPTYCHGKVWQHTSLTGVYRDAEYTYVQYFLGSEWYFDVETFILGKFSEMSDKAKKRIYTWSGLANRVLNERGIPVTDARLLALERDPVLREMWDRELAPDPQLVDLGDMELMSIPDERTFIDIHTLTRIEKPGQ